MAAVDTGPIGAAPAGRLTADHHEETTTPMHTHDSTWPRVAAAAAWIGLGSLIAACGTAEPTAGPTRPAVAVDATTGATPALDAAAQSGVTPRTFTPNLDWCDNAVTQRLGLGLKEFTTEAEGVDLLPGTMLWPDPATLPPGWAFEKGYYNARMQLGGRFKQSTMGLIYQHPDDADWEISVIYNNQYIPFEEPPEPHETITLRGGKTAYLFEPPFRETLHSVQWKEDCRLVSVIADLPVDQLLAVAEGLATRMPEGGAVPAAVGTAAPQAEGDTTDDATPAGGATPTGSGG